MDTSRKWAKFPWGARLEAFTVSAPYSNLWAGKMYPYHMVSTTFWIHYHRLSATVGLVTVQSSFCTKSHRHHGWMRACCSSLLPQRRRRPAGSPALSQDNHVLRRPGHQDRPPTAVGPYRQRRVQLGRRLVQAVPQVPHPQPQDDHPGKVPSRISRIGNYLPIAHKVAGLAISVTSCVIASQGKMVDVMGFSHRVTERQRTKQTIGVSSCVLYS